MTSRPPAGPATDALKIHYAVSMDEPATHYFRVDDEPRRG